MLQPRMFKRLLKYGFYFSIAASLYWLLDNVHISSADHHYKQEYKRASKSRFHSKPSDSEPNEPEVLSRFKSSNNIADLPDLTEKNSIPDDFHPEHYAVMKRQKYEDLSIMKCHNPIHYFYVDINPQPKLKHVVNVLTKRFKSKLTDNIHKATVIWYWYFPYTKNPKNGFMITAGSLDHENQILNNVPGTNFFTTKEFFVTNFIRDYIPEAHVAITPYLRENRKNYKWVIKEEVCFKKLIFVILFYF